MKITHDEMSVSGGWNQIRHNTEYDYLEGPVYTHYGIVEAYAQGSERFSYISTLRIVRDGRVYTKQFRGKRYTSRGLVTQAKRFAKEVYTD